MANRVIVEFSADDQGVAPTIEQLRDAIRGMGATAREVSEDTTAGAQATLTAFRAIGHGVQQVDADFRAGTLTTQGYQEAMARARREAIGIRQNLGDLSSKELSAYSSVIRNTTQQTGQAALGFGRLQQSVVRFAASAAGVPGPLGGIVSQVGQLAAGGPLVAGAVIGGALLVRMLASMGREARDAKPELQAALDLLGKIREGLQTPEQREGKALEVAKERRRELEEELIPAARRASNRAGGVDPQLEAELNALLLERHNLLFEITAIPKRDQAKAREDHEKVYGKALADVNESLVTARIEVGAYEKALLALAPNVNAARASEEALADALLRGRLEREGLTAAEIDGLVVLERQARAVRAERDARMDALRVLREYRIEMQQIGLGLRGAGTPTDRPPAPDGGGLDFEPITGAEFDAMRIVTQIGLAKEMIGELKGSLDALREGTLVGLEDAFLHVFDAIVTGGKVSGDQMVAGLLGAISKAARAEAAFYFARGVAALAASVFPFLDPGKGIAAGQYFAAAGMMGALGAGTGILARSIGGGGGGGGAGALIGRDSGQLTTESRVRREPLHIHLRGDVWGYTDPRFVDLIAAAFQEATDRSIIVTREPFDAGSGVHQRPPDYLR